MTIRRPVPDEADEAASDRSAVASRPDGARDKISRAAKALGLGNLRDDQTTKILEDAAREHDRDAMRRLWGRSWATLGPWARAEKVAPMMPAGPEPSSRVDLRGGVD